MLVLDPPRGLQPLEPQHRRYHSIVRKNKILSLLRFHGDCFPRSSHPRVDHHQKNRPLRIVCRHSIQKARSLYDGKRRHLMRDICDSNVRRDSINHRPANRQRIVRRAKIRHEHNGGARRGRLCRRRRSGLPRASSQRQKKQQSGQLIHARFTRTHRLSFGQKVYPNRARHAPSLSRHRRKARKQRNRAEGKLLSGKPNSSIPGPYAGAGLVPLLPSDGRCTADHSEHASDARTPVPPPSCGIHPYETEQSCAESRKIGISLVSFLHSTRIPQPAFKFLAAAPATTATRSATLHLLCDKEPFRRSTEHGSGQRNSGCNPGANHFSQRRTFAGHSGRASHKEPLNCGIIAISYRVPGPSARVRSSGSAAPFRAGTLTLIPSGSGIIHKEMPECDPPAPMQCFYLWPNLPASLKMTPPRYQEVKSPEI